MDFRTLKPEERHLFMLLGLMVQAAAFVELWLRMIAELLAESPHGSLLVSGEPVSRLTELCKVLVEVSSRPNEQQRDDLKALIGRTKQAFARRDQYVHGAWGTDVTTSERVTMRSRRLKPGLQDGPFNSADLDSLHAELKALNVELMDWLISVGNPDLVDPV
jgi:hypothetical protein